MDQFSEYQKAIELLSLSDNPRQIMEQLGDICFDGESFYHNGNKALATQIFKHIYALDAHSDYFHTPELSQKPFLSTWEKFPLSP
ncbi:hypothetical protein [Shewanella putrefaciens]